MGRTEDSPRPNWQVNKFLENLQYCLLKPLFCPLVRLALGGDLSMSYSFGSAYELGGKRLLIYLDEA